MPIRLSSNKGNLGARPIGLALFFLACTGQAQAQAQDGKQGYLASCPQFWPGLDKPGVSLDTGQVDWTPSVWDGYVARLIPENDGSYESKVELQLDCRYKGGRHVTVVVPGNDISCKIGPLPGFPKTKTLVCATRAEGGFPPPIVVSPAEPVTAQTTFKGMRLRQESQKIINAGRQLGYTETVSKVSEDGKPLEIIFTGPDEHITVIFSKTTRLSRFIELYRPIINRDWTVSKQFTLRFGFGFEYTNSFDDIWTSADGSISVTSISTHSDFYAIQMTDNNSAE